MLEFSTHMLPWICSFLCQPHYDIHTYKAYEREKKRRYLKHIHEVEHSSFLHSSFLQLGEIGKKKKTEKATNFWPPFLFEKQETAV